jgi:hypothetical protein
MPNRHGILHARSWKRGIVSKSHLEKRAHQDLTTTAQAHGFDLGVHLSQPGRVLYLIEPTRNTSSNEGWSCEKVILTAIR